MYRSLTAAPLGAGLLLFPFLGGCGVGTVGVVSGSTSSGDVIIDENSSPVISDFLVGVDGERAHTSPARLEFRLTDEEGDPSAVTLEYAIGSGAFQGLTLLPDGPGAVMDLSSLAPGVHSCLWDFESDLPGGAGYASDVQLRVSVADGNSIGPGSYAVGNDAPVINPDGTGFELPPGEESSGSIQVGFRVADSSQDTVDIRVEFNAQGPDYPEEGWRVARSVGLDPGVYTPRFALSNLELPGAGASLWTNFFWESGYAPPEGSNGSPQMAGLETPARLRFTAIDEFGRAGAPVVTEPIVVDNNERPLVSLEEGGFLLGLKDRGNIPISFKVTDKESDPVQVAIQWRRFFEGYPSARDMSGNEVPLSSLSSEDLADLITNPLRRQDRLDAQIALEAPLAFEGEVELVKGPGGEVRKDQVRLPSLADSQAGLLAYGLEGRELELLRPTRELEAQGLDTLSRPVDLLILGGGDTALVLHQPTPGSGQWRLIEVELISGTRVRTVTAGAGTPRTMDLDPSGRTLFVGTTEQVLRIDLVSGEVLGAISHDFDAGVRGLAAMGDLVVLATGDSEVLRLDFTPGIADEKSALLTNLAMPWGLTRDRLRENTVFLSVRRFINEVGDLGAVFCVDLDRLTMEPVVARVRDEEQDVLGKTPFRYPSDLAVEDGGSSLLVLTDESPTGNASTVMRLRKVSLRSPLDRNPEDGQRMADPFVDDLGILEDQFARGLATGAGRTRAAVLPGDGIEERGDLAVSGGVAQVRKIVGYDGATQTVSLDGEFTELEAGARWRVRASLADVTGSPEGRRFTYVWDSSVIPDPEGVLVRVLGRDRDLGIIGESTAIKPYRSSFDGSPPLPTAFRPESLEVGDLDGDGDLDLVAGGGGQLMLRLQNSARAFTAPIALGVGPGEQVTSTAVVDLDRDGQVEVVASVVGKESCRLAVFGPDKLGGWSEVQGIPLPGERETLGSVFAADLDSDGLTDLISAGASMEGEVEVACVDVLFNDPSGWQGSTLFVSDNASDSFHHHSVVPVELNGDGRLDLVAVDRRMNRIAQFLQSPGLERGFEPAEYHPSDERPRRIVAADLNGDGRQDIVVANELTLQLSLYLQRGVGGLEGPVELPVGFEPGDVDAADLDGDGDTDLVVVVLGDNTVMPFFQTSPGTFVEGEDELLLAGPPTCVTVADLDGAGTPDLLTAWGAGSGADQGGLSFFYQASAGGMRLHQESLPVARRPESVAGGDLDGDGDIDLVTANRGANELSICLQTSPGVYTTSSNALPTGGQPRSVVAADLDADGVLDLVSANMMGNGLSLYRGEGGGEFEPFPDLELQGEPAPTAVIATDLNGDGALDLVTANRVGGSLTVLRGIPGAGFAELQEPQVLGTDLTPVAVAAADLDRDGLPDLVTVCEGAGVIDVFRQLPGGGFSEPPLVLTLPANPAWVEIVDLDGDLKLDLVCALNGAREGQLLLLYQDESGQFVELEEVPPLPAGVSASMVESGDLDGDGDIDLVAVDPVGHRVRFYSQVSPREFVELQAPLTAAYEPAAVLTLDLDADGDLDVVTANATSSDLGLYLNGD